jgi:polysaccharide biosynthesis transport protein
MDVGYLLRILIQRKWLILSVMAAATLATFVLISQKPMRYRASVILSTGIVNYKGINSDNSDAFVQQYQVDNAFSNLLVFSQSRSTLKLLGLSLLQHDMTAGPKAYRQPQAQAAGISDAEFQQLSNELLSEIRQLNLDSITDPSFSQQFDYNLDRVSRAYGYDYDALHNALSVTRKGQTDYLSIDMVTNQPALAQFMANTYAKCLINYYHNLSVREKRKSVEVFTKLASDKKSVVDSISDLKYNYLKSKGLPALGKQSEELVAQIAQLEIEQQRAKARSKSTGQSLQQIDEYLKSKSNKEAEETRSRVKEKSSTDEDFQRVRELTQRSLETGGNDADVEAELADARTRLENSVRKSAKVLGKQRSEDSQRTREDLYKERVNTDLDRIEAERSAEQLRDEIWSLKSRLGSMAASDEISTRLEAEEERARNEFKDADTERIKAKMNLEKAENPLSIVENAQLPQAPEPNRQVLYSAFAGILSGTFSCLLLLVLAYLDATMKTPEQFKKFTDNLPLLGAVNAISLKGLDFNQVFSSNGNMPQYATFRESLRKIRSQIVQHKEHIYLIVSLKGKEGKSFTMHALAYSLAANNKRVLMLDTNFKTPLPEAYVDQPTPNATLLNKIIRDNGLAEVFQIKKKSTDTDEEHLIDIIGNTGLHRSPSELLEPESFQQFLHQLREHYDYILMESAAMGAYSDAQELAHYAEKIIAVFNARSVIRPSDKNTLQYLRDLRGQFAGSVLTEVEEKYT